MTRQTTPMELKVAEALAESAERGLWSVLPPDERALVCRHARAAIRAMWNPDEKMAEAAHDAYEEWNNNNDSRPSGLIVRVWFAMIDAASPKDDTP